MMDETIGMSVFIIYISYYYWPKSSTAAEPEIIGNGDFAANCSTTRGSEGIPNR